MRDICTAGDNQVWVQLETRDEASQEGIAMRHAVGHYFEIEERKAAKDYRSSTNKFFQNDIGEANHVQRVMPVFLSLRDGVGKPLATAMLPSEAERANPQAQIIIVGCQNGNPYVEHEAAIAALGQHFGLTLDEERCYPGPKREANSGSGLRR